MSLNNYLDICMPYCLKEVAPGEYCVLHREYRLVGDVTSTGPRDLVGEVRFKVTKKQLAQIEEGRNNDPRFGGGPEIYVYGEATHPGRSAAHWRRYTEKLRILGKCKVIS